MTRLPYLQHVPLLAETLRMLSTNDLSAADYPYAAASQVRQSISQSVSSIQHANACNQA